MDRPAEGGRVEVHGVRKKWFKADMFLVSVLVCRVGNVGKGEFFFGVLNGLMGDS